MSGNTQKPFRNIPALRSQTSNDNETGNAVPQPGLPPMAGKLADSAHADPFTQTPVTDRDSADIASCQYDKAMASVRTVLRPAVPNTFDNTNIAQNLDSVFSTIKLFSPAKVAIAVPKLEQLLKTRACLNNLLARLQNNERLHGHLTEVAGK